jgi:tyrosinase
MPLYKSLLAIAIVAASVVLPAALAQEPYPITGVQTGTNVETGEVPSRKNINDLYAQGGPQW